MTTQPSRKPWHQVVQLRDDLKTGELSLAVFAADLHDVVMQKGRRLMSIIRLSRNRVPVLYRSPNLSFPTSRQPRRHWRTS